MNYNKNNDKTYIYYEIVYNVIIFLARNLIIYNSCFKKIKNLLK